MNSTHPLDMGPHSTKLRGVWVRHKGTGFVGYISHVERPRNKPVGVWVVYLPGQKAKGNKLNTWSASGARVEELVKLKRKRRNL